MNFNLKARLSVLSIFLLALSANAATLTVNTASPGGPLKHAGLGSLFGITSNSVGPWKSYFTNSLIFVSEHQGRIGENGSVPNSTEAVAPVIRDTPVRMMCRFGDLCYGFAPGIWPGLNNTWISPGSTYSWLAQVTNAVNSIKSNYQDVVYAIAIFNEPDGELNDANFFNDPNIPGTNQFARINYVWTQTYRVIRAALPNVKIMGPNYEDYRPQYFASHQTIMHDFLTNAIFTGTVPDIIGWHNLNAIPAAPADVGIALTNYYRALETSLHVPGAPLPVSIEEFGANNNAFEGIPGRMVPYWAEFERDGIDFGCMGIYENGGDLGNTMRYTMWDDSPTPNAGWFMMNWYRQMQGQYLPVTPHGIDGVASWNATNQTVTVLLGGADGDTTVQVNGLGALGLGSSVRVRLDMAYWTTNANVANLSIACGGDPQTGAYNIYDRGFALDANGNLAIPVNAVEGIYNGYRLLITATNAPDTYPTKYEAEKATCNHVTLHNGADGQYQASGGAYIGGIDFLDSYVSFHVTAPSNGLYNLFIRYAANIAYGAASHFVTVNGQSQGVVNYPPTSGWSTVELRTTTYPVSLVAGANDITLTHATNYAELDFIDVRPDTHRYQAELATNNDVALKPFNTCSINDCVASINNSDSYIQFAVTVPVAGNYKVGVAYANGTSVVGTHLVTVNGVSAGSIAYVPTGGWLGGGFLTGNDPSQVTQISAVTEKLNAGLNTIRLTHANNYAELDYLKVTPATNLTPAIPRLSLQYTNQNASLTWPAPASGYLVQQTADLTQMNWLTVTNAINLIDGQNQLTFPATSTSAFFRLYP